MATRKNSTQPIPPSDALIVEKNEFTNILLDRIRIGQELVGRNVSNTEEFQTNKDDYFRWNDYNSEYLKQSFNNEDNQYKIYYDRVNSLGGLFFGGRAKSLHEELREFKEDIKNKVEHLERLVEKVPLLKSTIITPSHTAQMNKEVGASNNDIFIVHGHDISAQQSVARVIQALGLNPIILSEKPNQGKTVIEKFEANSNVGFAIVLMTDDDIGKGKAENGLNSRARQNVILELGYFIGKLGRGKVCPLYSDGVELPSDIHGVIYEPLDLAGRWKFALVRELRAAGYEVDANRIL